MKLHFAPNDVYPKGFKQDSWRNGTRDGWSAINTIHPKFFKKVKELLKPRTPDACNQ